MEKENRNIDMEYLGYEEKPKEKHKEVYDTGEDDFIKKELIKSPEGFLNKNPEELGKSCCKEKVVVNNN